MCLVGHVTPSSTEGWCAVLVIYDALHAHKHIYNDNVDDHYTLTVNGYGEILYNRLFVENTTGQLKYWEFMNSNYSLYVKYIKLYPLKDEVVGILCEELAKTVWNPKFLQQALNAFFKEDLNKKNEFVAKATALGFELPAPITELFV